MQDYIIDFIGHVIEEIRPSGFPTEVHHSFVVRVDSMPQLQSVISDQAIKFIQQRGMYVFKDKNATIEVTKDGGETGVDNRMYVPMHMLSHIETKTKVMVKATPDIKEGPSDAHTLS